MLIVLWTSTFVNNDTTSKEANMYQSTKTSIGKNFLSTQLNNRRTVTFGGCINNCSKFR